MAFRAASFFLSCSNGSRTACPSNRDAAAPRPHSFRDRFGNRGAGGGHREQSAGGAEVPVSPRIRVDERPAPQASDGQFSVL